MGILDWLLNDPSQPDGGFLAALLNGREPSGSNTAARRAPLHAPARSLLGESALINLLRSGFAGMNSANGYSGFGPQFAAGVAGGQDAMGQRRQQLAQDRYDPLAMGRAVGSAESGLGQASPTAAGQSAPAQCSGCAERNKTAVPAEPSSPNADPAAGPKPGLPGSTREVPVKVASIEDVAKLPSGAWFETPDGQILRRGIGEAR